MSGSDNVFGLPADIARQSRAPLPSDAARAGVSASPSPADLARRAAKGSGPGGSAPADRSSARTPKSSSLLDADRAVQRRKRALVGVVLAVFVVLSLCATSSVPAFVSPLEVLQCYAIFFQRMLAPFVDPANAPVISEVLAEHPTYYWTLSAANYTLVFLLCGFMLALSGALYQNVFRNPIAAPSMLGISSGVQLAAAITVMVFSQMATQMVLAHYALAYAVVCVIMAVLFGLTWLMTGPAKPFNVNNLLVVGVIINQFVGVIVTFIVGTVFDEELYDIYLLLANGSHSAVSPVEWAFLLGGFALSVLPVLVIRFRMNALSFSRAEARMFGVSPVRLQALALVCGTVAMVNAQLQVGPVAMITLVVPHVSRALFGSEFRKQLAGTLLLGAALLLGCRLLALALAEPFAGLFPLGVVVNLVLLPVFVWMIATQQRRWD